jgi:glutaredoxin
MENSSAIQQITNIHQTGSSIFPQSFINQKNRGTITSILQQAYYLILRRATSLQ